MTYRLTALDFRSDVLRCWCPGCGHFGVLAALERALAELGRPPHEVAVVSGIGCASRIVEYTRAFGIQGSHGRAIPVAEGLKLARPALEVLAVTGDGDAYAIGGNHFLHACRRNLDIACIVLDNRVHGITRGRPSPTADARDTGATPLNPLSIALAAGANFVARGFSGDLNGLANIMLEAIRWPGFALVDVLSPCVTYRPDQAEWEERVHREPQLPYSMIGPAGRALLEDDGFGIGIFYRGALGRTASSAALTTSVDEIEKELYR